MSARNLFNLGVAIALLIPAAVLANETLRPRDFTELGGELTLEHAHAIAGVRVAWVDYEALRRDFPALRGLSNGALQEWLVREFSYIGSEQPRLREIRNTTFALGEGTVPAFRPPDWNRSAMLEAHGPAGEVIGMVDIKGFGHGARTRDHVRYQVSRFEELSRLGDRSGIDLLRIMGHSDGLMSFGEAIAEVTRQKAVQRLFELHRTGLETVESYAILRLPFNLLKQSGEQVAAAFYLRQANLRGPGSLEVSPEIYIDPAGGRQRTLTGAAVDFGGVLVRSPILKDRFGLLPGSEDRPDPQSSLPWSRGHEVAMEFDRGDPSAVFRHVQEMLAPLEPVRSLPSLGPPLGLRSETSVRPRSLEEIRRELRSPYPFARRQAALALRGRSDPRSLEIIGSLLESSDIGTRELGALALLNRRDADSLSWIEVASRSEAASVRRHAMEALTGRPEPRAFELLERGLADRDPWVCEESVRALAGRSDPRALEVLARALTDASPAIRQAAVSALEGARDEESLRLLGGVVEDPDRSIRVKTREILRSALQSDPSLARLPLWKTSFGLAKEFHDELVLARFKGRRRSLGADCESAFLQPVLDSGF